jgi:aspartate kinase
MDIKVAKFGGTSLADAARLRNAATIVQQDPGRRFVVVSAPGARFPGDTKITDLLLTLATGTALTERITAQALIRERLDLMCAELGVTCDFSELFEALAAHMHAPDPALVDFIVSRGEYACALIMAEVLGFHFVDAADVIQLRDDGTYDADETTRRRGALVGESSGYVIPGFYGALKTGKVKTFSRGGSDLTGSIIASLLHVDCYENWTDVSGVYCVDPRVVPHALACAELTYREVRELSYGGATVLHEDVVFPLESARIPLVVRNTLAPHVPGTRITHEVTTARPAGSIVGIAGKGGYAVVTLEKRRMNHEVGFVRRVAEVFEHANVSIERMPSGTDTLSVIVDEGVLNDALGELLPTLRSICAPDNITISGNMALVVTVGVAMKHTPGVAARLLTAVADAGINVRTIDQGASELSITIGVDETDLTSALRAIYEAFVQ